MNVEVAISSTRFKNTNLLKETYQTLPYIISHIDHYWLWLYEYYELSNARDTTNFTTKFLQTDMASSVEDTASAIKVP